MNLPIILASQSQGRLKLLKQIKIIPNKIWPANIDETPLRNELPNKLAIRLAYQKAHFVAGMVDHGLIIAADTVSVAGRMILSKAETTEHVRNCMTKLSGRRHRVYTAVCVIKKTDDQLIVRQKIVVSIVKFKRLTNQEIDFYCQLGEGLNKSGGCSISGYAEAFVSFISGSYSNITGLPLLETMNMLSSLGYKSNVKDV